MITEIFFSFPHLNGKYPVKVNIVPNPSLPSILKQLNPQLIPFKGKFLLYVSSPKFSNLNLIHLQFGLLLESV